MRAERIVGIELGDGAGEASHRRDRTQIVGEDEASIKEGRISIGSPIARALIGKEVEDVVTVKAPGGDVDYEILSIKYI